MNKEIERRILCKEVRVDSTGDKPLIRGYAALFNSLSEDLGGFREQLATGAFTAALGSSDVRALINHDPNLVLGRNKAGTLTMREDASGLFVEIMPPDTQAARDLVALMTRGDVSQMSFAFTVAKEDQTWTREGTGPWLRTIKRVSQLYDVSVVTYPAYSQTSAAVRALEERQAEDSAAGLAQAQAQAALEHHARARDIDLMEARS
jgi:HK97 family phage prohead protease